MATPMPERRSMWRRITAWYSGFLSWLVAISTVVLVIPVTLQIFSRFTSIIPHYIWTEEMARFLLVWTVMIGAMIGVRESTHFEVDVWPRLSPRPEAAVRLIASASWTEVPPNLQTITGCSAGRSRPSIRHSAPKRRPRRV